MICAYVCVCVREREKKERGNEGEEGGAMCLHNEVAGRFSQKVRHDSGLFLSGTRPFRKRDRKQTIQVSFCLVQVSFAKETVKT